LPHALGTIVPEAEHPQRRLRRAWVIFVLAWAAFALGFAALSGAGRVCVVLIAVLAAATGVAAVALWRRS
jgi:hypothetical protein